MTENEQIREDIRSMRQSMETIAGNIGGLNAKSHAPESCTQPKENQKAIAEMRAVENRLKGSFKVIAVLATLASAIGGGVLVAVIIRLF
ncbi:hypothetical protein LCGC14_0637610 [marine sediment metagenome]|uniref:t-SNARE coiled-coil homology domain-containing protein n=1 Tax=marine sediment metagenome TaxID=412755 RepID=A0A0F9R049_9ZZZZ